MATKHMTILFAIFAAASVQAMPAVTTITQRLGGPVVTSTVVSTSITTGVAPMITGMNAVDMMSMVSSVNDQMGSDMMSAMSSTMDIMNSNNWYASYYMSQNGAATTTTAAKASVVTVQTAPL